MMTLTGGESERVGAADVRYSEVAERQWRAWQDQEGRRAANRGLHLQIRRRLTGARTHQGQKEIKGSLPSTE